MGERRAPDHRQRGLHGALRGLEVARLAQQAPEAIQGQRGHAVACRHRVIGQRSRALDELLVVVRGEQEAAAVLVLEMRQQRLRHGHGKREVVVPPAELQHFQRGVEHEGMVVEVRGEARPAVLPRRLQPPVHHQLAAHEIHGALRGFGQRRVAQDSRRDRHAANHQPVPGRQHLLIAARPHARLAGREQLRAGARQPGPDLAPVQAAAGRELVDRHERMQMPAALEVGSAIQAVNARHHRILAGFQQALDLLARPGIEAAFLAL